MKTIITNTEEETKKLGNYLAAQNENGGLICLEGDLGTGKTQLTKGIAEYFGIENYSIKSPTYTYVREYQINKDSNFIHIDLYRVDEVDELLIKEIEEHLENKKNIVVIEWSDKIPSKLQEKQTEAKLEYVNSKQRKITINEPKRN